MIDQVKQLAAVAGLVAGDGRTLWEKNSAKRLDHGTAVSSDARRA